MRVRISVVVFGVAVLLAGCNRTAQPLVKNSAAQQQVVASVRSEPKAPKPFSEIDLLKICNLAAKGRAQDLHYNNSEVINDLVANGKDSIPFLIGKLGDRTLMPCHVEDYWPQMMVGDIAFIVLTDFSTDYAWEKATIPGTGWDEFFQAKYDRKMTGSDYYYQQIRRHGRSWVKAKWQKIWETYKDQIVWNEKGRCVKAA